MGFIINMEKGAIFIASSVHDELLDEIDELHEITEELINSCRID